MKPSWDKHAPHWANFLAQDYHGDWWFYEGRPQASGLTWCFIGRCEKAGVPTENDYWTDTLEERP